MHTKWHYFFHFTCIRWFNTRYQTNMTVRLPNIFHSQSESRCTLASEHACESHCTLASEHACMCSEFCYYTSGQPPTIYRRAHPLVPRSPQLHLWPLLPFCLVDFHCSVLTHVVSTTMLQCFRLNSIYSLHASNAPRGVHTHESSIDSV